MRVPAMVKELRRSLFLSGPSAVAPPELSGNWDLADYFSIACNTSATQRASGGDSPPSQCLQYFRLPFVYRSG